MSRLPRRAQFLVAIAVFALIAPATSAQQGQRVCAISDYKMEDAKTTFARITAVFRHPRCINCHGAERPFASDSDHADGAAYEVLKDKDGGVNFAKTNKQCENCHGDFNGWRMAPDEIAFVGQNDVALCRLLKFQLTSGENLIEHFTNDRGGLPFIEVAFKGTRGLNELGRSLVNPYRPEPIEGVTQSQLVSLARRWLSDIGSEEGPIGGDAKSDCGCVPHHYALQLHNQVTINYQGIHWEAGFASDPKIPLIFDGNQTFHSETTTAAQSGNGSGGPCSMQGGGSVTLSAKGRLVDGPIVDRHGNPQAIMKVTVTGVSSGASGSAECPQGSMSATGPGGSGSKDFELNAVVGAKSQEIPTLQGVPGGGGTMWVKLIQID